MAHNVEDDGRGFGYGFATLQDPSWRLGEVSEALQARLLSGDERSVVRSISTDTRTLVPGDLFLALQGENFDGSSFIHEAVKRGAACVVTEKTGLDSLPVPVIVVDDALQALGRLARYRRQRMKDLRVLAVTGSCGKTTVKEMTATILHRSGSVLKTKGNFNNLVGLPLSLLPVAYRHKYAILEMGMNRSGEIARLTAVACPDVACILNISAAHIQGLGSVDGVAAAKGELFQCSGPETVFIVNRDDSRVVRLARLYKNPQVTFGCHKESGVRATRMHSKGPHGISYTLQIGRESQRIHLPLCGRHNVLNSLAAAALAHAVGTSFDDIVTGLQACRAHEKRFEVHAGPGKSILVNDSYNANPASMRAAIETVNGMRKGGQAVAILGDMLELGDLSSDAHREVGTMVARNDFNYLLTVGRYGPDLIEAAVQDGMSGERARFFETKADLFVFMRSLFQKGALGQDDVLLFKGSRGMRMETLFEQFVE